MTKKHGLDGLDLNSATLVREWVVTVDTPDGGVEPVLKAIGDGLPLVQGPYDNNIFVREGGYQRFRALSGSHAGAEGTVQQTAASQIVFSIPPDRSLLSKAFDVIFAVHVNEEPTIRVEEVWGSRSKLLDDEDNPNRYWNRPDASAIYGGPVD